MGFELFEGTTILDFAGTRYAGVEVVVRSDVTLEQYEAFLAAEGLAGEWDWFAQNVLVSWNLQSKGESIATDTPLAKLPAPFVRKLIRGWQTAFVEIDTPLAPPSTSP